MGFGRIHAEYATASQILDKILWYVAFRLNRSGPFLDYGSQSAYVPENVGCLRLILMIHIPPASPHIWRSACRVAGLS